jgi:hypothetical protein
MAAVGAVTEMPFRQYSHEAADQAVDFFSLQVAAGTYGQSTVRESCQVTSLTLLIVQNATISARIVCKTESCTLDS